MLVGPGKVSTIDVRAKMSGPDYGVGIMGPGIEELSIFGENGEEITLTDNEYDELYEDEELYNKLADMYYGDDVE